MCSCQGACRLSGQSQTIGRAVSENQTVRGSVNGQTDRPGSITSPGGEACDELLRKEVIQPHLPIRLPCYDLTPIISPTFDSCLLAVGPLASGVANSRGLTGGVYKARERIHRDMLIRDY